VSGEEIGGIKDAMLACRQKADGWARNLMIVHAAFSLIEQRSGILEATPNWTSFGDLRLRRGASHA